MTLTIEHNDTSALNIVELRASKMYQGHKFMMRCGLPCFFDRCEDDLFIFTRHCGSIEYLTNSDGTHVHSCAGEKSGYDIVGYCQKGGV